MKKASSANLTDREEVLICNPTRYWYTTRHCYATCQSTLGFRKIPPRLQGDAVAKDELSVQQIQAEQDVFSEINSNLWAGLRKTLAHGYHKGQFIDTINSQGTRNAYLSENLR